MKVELKASGFELNGELEKYAQGKAAQIAKSLPRELRPQATCTMHFTQTMSADGTKVSTCKLQLTSGEQQFLAQESTQHMYAALDIAAVHIEQQLADALDQSKPPVTSRIKQKLSKDEWQV